MKKGYRVLTLISGSDAAGEASYAYVSMPFEGYWRFKNRKSDANIDCEEYGGQVLFSGKGFEPDEKRRAYMENKYHASHTLEADLLKASDGVLGLFENMPIDSGTYWRSRVGMPSSTGFGLSQRTEEETLSDETWNAKEDRTPHLKI
jgi:hypothetical protein